MNEEIKLYGCIGSPSVDAQQFAAKLSDLESNGCKYLTIKLHSYGGSVFEGNAMRNAAAQSKMKIKVVIDGIAASMASVFLLGADEVEICDNAFIMIHRPTSNSTGDADDHSQTAKLLKSMEDDFAKGYAKKTGLTVQEVKSKWLNGKDHWLNANEAVKYGFAQKKVPAVVNNIKNLDNVKVAAMKIEAIYNKYAASLTNNKSNMKKELIEKFALEGVTEENSDSEVIDKLLEKFEELKSNSEKETEEKVEAVIKKAQQKGVTISNYQMYKQIGLTSGVSVLETVLNNIQPVNINDMIKNHVSANGAKSKSEWTLEDYRKNDPGALKDNPKLFDELYKNEYGTN